MVTHESLAVIQRRLFGDCQETMHKGAAEYALGPNALANFERIASCAGVSREVVLMTYLQKHVDGCWAFTRGHRSQRESVSGRIRDAINYLTLLEAMAVGGSRFTLRVEVASASGRPLPAGVVVWPIPGEPIGPGGHVMCEFGVAGDVVDCSVDDLLPIKDREG